MAYTDTSLGLQRKTKSLQWLIRNDRLQRCTTINQLFKLYKREFLLLRKPSQKLSGSIQLAIFSATLSGFVAFSYWPIKIENRTLLAVLGQHLFSAVFTVLDLR